MNNEGLYVVGSNK